MGLKYIKNFEGIDWNKLNPFKNSNNEPKSIKIGTKDVQFHYHVLNIKQSELTTLKKYINAEDYGGNSEEDEESESGIPWCFYGNHYRRVSVDTESLYNYKSLNKDEFINNIAKYIVKLSLEGKGPIYGCIIDFNGCGSYEEAYDDYYIEINKIRLSIIKKMNSLCDEIGINNFSTYKGVLYREHKK